jgi:hypothetical protein
MFISRDRSRCARLACWAGQFLLVTAGVSIAQAQVAPSNQLTLAVTGLNTDNFYYSDDELRSVSGLETQLRFRHRRETSRLRTEYRLQALGAAYNFSRRDNYVDALAATNLAWSSGRHALNADLSAHLSRDPFGSIRTEGETSFDRELDRWRNLSASLAWLNGADGRSRLLTEARVFVSDRQYITNEDFTQFLDRRNVGLNLLAGANLSIKTALFFNVFTSDTQFDNEQPGTPVVRSGRTVAYMGGIRWKATANTSGDVRAGVATREPDDDRGEFDSSFWSADVQWRPGANDTVRLHSDRGFSDSYIFESEFIDVQRHSIDWIHDWSLKTTTNIGLSYEERDFVTANELDEISRLFARINYRMDQNFFVFVSGSRLERTTTRPGLDFERAQIEAGFEAQLN